MKIIIEPNPILHKKCRKVARFDNELKKFAKAMAKTLDENAGIGLAAPQVGKSIRLVVIGHKPEKLAEIQKKDDNQAAIAQMILANPKITKFSTETNITEEGCLSLPKIEIKIKRANKVSVLAYDLEGNRLKIRAKGLLARVLQHEIDHLDGILITDRKIK
ncbi:MAG: peptide deformylase [Patescibacteria group bacterium]|nr:peptide deformylase [Patescibacteria group bacterium]